MTHTPSTLSALSQASLTNSSSISTPSTTNPPTFLSSQAVPARAKAINPELKEQILKEASLAKEPLTVIAKRHNIKVDRIYHWRMIEKRVIFAKAKSQDAKNFHEVEVEPPQDAPFPSLSSSSLQRAELEFSDYSISIKGKIELDKFIRACKLLSS